MPYNSEANRYPILVSMNNTLLPAGSDTEGPELPSQSDEDSDEEIAGLKRQMARRKEARRLEKAQEASNSQSIYYKAVLEQHKLYGLIAAHNLARQLQIPYDPPSHMNSSSSSSRSSDIRAGGSIGLVPMATTTKGGSLLSRERQIERNTTSLTPIAPLHPNDSSKST